MKRILLQLEAAGCNTSCMHCWAKGGQYANIPLHEIEYITGELHEFCTEHGYGFDICVMHEALAHPQIVEVLKTVKQNMIGTEYKDVFEPIPTSGVSLATREDWREVLEGVRELGTNTLWFAFHGIGEAHDKAVNRKGAYKELCKAIERAQSIDFAFGCNVFITKENLKQWHELKDMLKSLNWAATLLEVARYEPSERAVTYDSIRPQLEDLLPVRDEIAEMCPSWNRHTWDNLYNCTEASYYKRALVSSDQEFLQAGPGNSDTIFLACNNNLEICHGVAKIYGKSYGNFRSDRKVILNNLLEDIETGKYDFSLSPKMHYQLDKLPSIKELAEKHGDPNGTKIYPDPESMMHKWLDNAFGSQRKR